jgi:hypothetical protein
VKRRFWVNGCLRPPMQTESLTGDRYQMTLPKEISGLKIEAALLRLAATEDEGYFLHPEHLVSCLSKTDTENWQLRLKRLPWLQRVADRAFLLGENYV